jgi:hypothetical protein
MKYLTTSLLLLSFIFSLSVSAKVTVIINTTAYEFEQPIRLSNVLSIVENNGEWYWPTSAVYDLTDSTAEREKEAVLSHLRKLLGAYSDNVDMRNTLESLYTQISNWTVATRKVMPVSYNRARLIFADNPMFKEGRYLIRLSGRPNVVHFSGVVAKPGAYEHKSNTSLFTLHSGVKSTPNADNSFVYVVAPGGTISKRGIAYWNIDFTQLMPGSHIVAPLSTGLFDSTLDTLNARIAALAVHRILP